MSSTTLRTTSVDKLLVQLVRLVHRFTCITTDLAHTRLTIRLAAVELDPGRAHPSAPRYAHCEFDAAAAVAVAVESTAVAREGDVVEEAVHRSSVCCNHPPNRAWRDHCKWFDALHGSSRSIVSSCTGEQMLII